MAEQLANHQRTRAFEHQHNGLDPKTAVPLLSTEKPTTVIPGWPTSPKHVRSSWGRIIWNITFDLLLFSCSVAFLVFAGFVSHYNQVPTDENPQTTSMLLDATRFGPTVFPILFALTIARATHTILRWRLECGERIGVLDTLAASTSLTSTMVSQFQLRAVSVWGLVLIIIWALSPVGGQASLRQMAIETRNTTQPASFDYLIHHGYAKPIAAIGTARNSVSQIVNTTFTGGIIGSPASRSSPVDTWGNVKIPRIEHFESKGEPDSEGWFKTVSGGSDSFSSMIGIPMVGTNSSDFVNYNTTIQSLYMNTDCTLTLRPGNGLVVIPEAEANYTGPGRLTNITGAGAVITYENATQYPRAYSDPDTLAPLQFQYWTKLWTDHNHVLTCNLSSSYLEVEITCPNRASCSATRVRRSKLNHPRSEWTQFDLFWDTAPSFFRIFLATSTSRDGWPTILDRYMSDPDSVITLGQDGDTTKSDGREGTVPLTTEENYSIRLSQLMNSLWTIMGGMYTIAGSLDNETSYEDVDPPSFLPPENLNHTSRGTLWHQFLAPSNLSGKAWSSEGTKDLQTEVIVANKPWVIVLCISSIVLIIASLVSPIMHFSLIKGPEVLMNISSLATRHNAYIPLPDGGTYLGASARARLLKNTELRLGDVEKGTDVGHLAIGTLTSKDDSGIGRIRKEKMYE